MSMYKIFDDIGPQGTYWLFDWLLWEVSLLFYYFLINEAFSSDDQRRKKMTMNFSFNNSFSIINDLLWS